MLVEKVDFKDTGLFSSLFIDFLNKKSTLDPFYGSFPDIAGFDQMIQSRKLDPQIRNVLSAQLAEQYNEPQEQVKKNIELLREESAFTITTGHQLNIFTGPLYFIYKIITVINACKQLKERYPDKHFIPVYWMASEDHDFEEISYFTMLGKTYRWSTDQKGAVGRMDPSELAGIIDEMPGDHEIFRKAYLEQSTLSDAVRSYVDALFGKEGLVVLDADNAKLKKGAIELFREDLLAEKSHGEVVAQSARLEELGYKTQVAGREINLFYLENGLRERIVKEGERYQVLNTDLTFSQQEMIDLLEKHPDRFSPNVILRPVYQELILPNLAYVGGPAEVVYWLQLKTVFDTAGVSFPILLPRNFALVIDPVAQRKMEVTGSSSLDVFKTPDELIKAKVETAHENVRFSKEERAIKELFTRLKTEVVEIDPTLEALVEAEKKRSLNRIRKIEDKSNKAILRKHRDFQNQVESWHSMLFPNGSIQERTINFLQFAIDRPDFVDQLLNALDPLDLRYHLLRME